MVPRFKNRQDFMWWYSNVYLRSHWWRSFRAEQLKFRPICEECLSARATELHHRHYYDDLGSILGREKASDVTSICHECHMEIEANKRRLRNKEKVDKIVGKILKNAFK